MDLQAQGALFGASATLVAGVIAAGVAWRTGRLHFGLMQRSHDLNVSKATPRIGFHCTVAETRILPQGYNPHLFITVEIYNEGELAVQSVKGKWQYLPPNVAQKIVRSIDRDFLGKCEKYTDTYLIEQSANWPLGTGRFDVDVEFFYAQPGTPDTQHYKAHYRYNANGQQMVRITE